MSAYSPKYGAIDTSSGADQFAASRISNLSTSVTPIELLCDTKSDEVLGHATGFFWTLAGRTFLITNWHVVTGNDVFTKRVISKSGLQPSRIRFFGVQFSQCDSGEDYWVPDRASHEMDLFIDGIPVWRQHPKFDELCIDLVAIEIPMELLRPSRSSNGVLNAKAFPKLFHMAGNDVMIVGYPLRSYIGAMLPIWKRGSLATEPLAAVDGKPMFFVDAATTRGMSGSPVIRRVFGPAAMADLTIRSDAICFDEFVGVYAGRLESNDLERVNLGYAWHGVLVDQIINGGVPGTTC
jgi:hypothetical protein